jgi:hypothetical protein
MLVLRREAADRNDTHETTRDPDTRLEDLAADLTSAVYPLLLRRGLKGSWVKVQLALWRALSTAVKEWARRWRPAASSRQSEAWREGLLADLTERAFSIARNNGIEGPFDELERGVFSAFRRVLRGAARANV